MSEKIPKFLSEEVVAERPRVFPDAETWRLSLKFASQYLKLKEDFDLTKNPESVEDLVLSAENAVNRKTAEILPGFMEGAGFSHAQSGSVLRAVVDRDFSELVNEKDNVMALSFALIADKVRSKLTASSLEKMDHKDLYVFGMTPDQRDIIVMLLDGLSSVNAEFLRFKVRAIGGAEYPEKPADAVREHSRVAKFLDGLRKHVLQKGASNLFEESGDDFLRYIEALGGLYRPVTPSGKLYTQKERGNFTKKALDSFADFTKKHPNHPLIIIPPTGSYVETRGGVDLGLDPEIRVLWQSPAEAKLSEELKKGRDSFADHIEREYPEHASSKGTADIKQTYPIVCSDIASFGVNMTFNAEALVWGDVFFLIRNREKSELFIPIKETMKDLFGNKWDGVIESPSFFDYIERQLMNHELGHRMYEEVDTEASKTFGKDIYESIEEHKADIISAASLSDALDERARKDFPGMERKAINLAIVGNMICCATISPEGELGDYHRSAVASLNYLSERGFFESDEHGASINEEMLNRDLSKEVFLPQAKAILELYRAVKFGSAKEKSEARDRAKYIIGQKPNGIIQKLLKQYKTSQRSAV